MRRIVSIAVVVMVLIAGPAFAQIFGAPGPTKSITQADTFKNIGAMWMGTTATVAKNITSPTGQSVRTTLISVSANAALVCWGATSAELSAVTCHTIPSGSSITMNGAAWVIRGWVKNASAGSNAVLTITPEF